MKKNIKKVVYKITKAILPNSIFKKFEKWCNEQKFISGENRYRFDYFLTKKKSDEKYCIFRADAGSKGILTVANSYIFLYEWAISKGYIPVMDMEYEYCFKNYILGEDNLWEYIFEQPIKINDVLKKDYVLVKAIDGNVERLSQICMDINGSADDYRIHTIKDGWREYYAKVNAYVSKCWNFRRDLLDEFESEYSYIFKEENVLGVALREVFSVDADKWVTNPDTIKILSKHPKTMGINEIVELVKKYAMQHKCSKIFVSTFYKESLNLFIDIFGNKVVWVKRERASMSSMNTQRYSMSLEEQYDYLKSIYSPETQKEKTITYIKEVLALSRCNYLIAPPCSASIAALSLNGGKYKDICILSDFNKSTERY